MDKDKGESSKKSKDVIIFSPQELADLGILQNIEKVQASPNMKSKANKKRIIQVIQQSMQTLTANKTNASTSASVSSLPVVNSHDLKKNLMGKLSPSQITKPENEKSERKTPAKIINSDIVMPSIPLREKARAKSSPLIIKKGKKKTNPEVKPNIPASKTPVKSILNKDKRIKDIIISAVHSRSKQGSSVTPNISKDNENLDSPSPPSTKQVHTSSNRVIDPSDQSKVENQSRDDNTLSLSNKSPLKIMKKDIKVVSNTEISLTKEQIKHLIRPKTLVQDIAASNQLVDNENRKVETQTTVKKSKEIDKKINANTTKNVNTESRNEQNNSMPGISAIIGCEKVKIGHEPWNETNENISKADFFNCTDSSLDEIGSSTLDDQNTSTEIKTTEVDVEKVQNKKELKKLDSTILIENQKDLPLTITSNVESLNSSSRDSDNDETPFESSEEPSIDVLKATTIVCSNNNPTEKPLPEPSNETEKLDSKELKNSVKGSKDINQKEIVVTEEKLLLHTEVSEDCTQGKLPVKSLHKDTKKEEIDLVENMDVDDTKIPSYVLKKNKQQVTLNYPENAENDHYKINETNPNEVLNLTGNISHKQEKSKGLTKETKFLTDNDVNEIESTHNLNNSLEEFENKELNSLNVVTTEASQIQTPMNVPKKRGRPSINQPMVTPQKPVSKTNTKETVKHIDNYNEEPVNSSVTSEVCGSKVDNNSGTEKGQYSGEILNKLVRNDDIAIPASDEIKQIEHPVVPPVSIKKKRGRPSINQPIVTPQKPVSKTDTKETVKHIDNYNQEPVNSSVTSEVCGSRINNNSGTEKGQYSLEILSKLVRNDDNAIHASDEIKQIELPVDPHVSIQKKRGRPSLNQPIVTLQKPVSKTNTKETVKHIDNYNEEPVNSSVTSEVCGSKDDNNSGTEKRQYSGEIPNKLVRNDDNAIPASDEIKQIEHPVDPPVGIQKKRGRPSINQPIVTPQKPVSKTDTKETVKHIDNYNQEPVNSSVTSEVCGSRINNNSGTEKRQYSGEISNKLVRNDDNAIPASDEINKMEQPVDPPVNIQKKRGRPRKNPLDPPKPKKPKLDTSNESILGNSLDGVNLENVEMDTSKSGRKRRKINYFKMENIFLDELAESKSKYQSPEKEGEEKAVKGKSRKLSFENPVSVSKTEGEEKPVEIKNRKPSFESPVILKTESVFIKPESLGKYEAEPYIEPNNIPMEVTEETLADIEESVITEESTPTSPQEKKSKSNKKYNWTGETQKMVKSIFSAAMKATMTGNNSNQQDEIGDEEQTQYTSRGRGRRKKGQQTFTSAIIDNDGYVKCNTCNSKVVNKEWQSHNRNVHYNLAWREGEQFLNVDDPVFVRRTLTPIIHEDKGLVCTNCTYSFYVANEFITHREHCLGIVKDGLVTCAICQEQVDKLKWLTHKKKKHNNLTWRVGDPPLDLNNQEMVLYILNAFYKAKIPLYCYKCRSSKKSVVGFLSHQAQCGIDIENAKIPCPLCGKRILPVSMPTHNKLVHEPKPEKPAVEEVKEPTGGKRKAAKQAMKMIDIISKSKLDTVSTLQYVESPDFKEEEFVLKFLNEELEENHILKCKFQNCDYTHDKLEQMVEHLAECPKKPEQFFICKKCFSMFPLEEDVRNHIRIVHNGRMVDGDYVDDDSSDGEDEDKKQLVKIRLHEKELAAKNANVRILVKPRFLSSTPKDKKLFSDAFEYTLEFCNEHFTESVLFDRLRYMKRDWKLLNDQHLENYMPQVEFSCHVNTKVVSKFSNMLKYDHTFNRLELFEVFEEEDGATIFCGGPILAMAWQPTPHILLNCKQVLAVAAGRDFDAKYLVNTNYSEPCLIQFWDFGILKKKITPPKPKFIFGLAISYGPIWHMEWCPSGCFDERLFTNDRMQRMGLLAVAGSVPTVNIYAIPFIEEGDDIGLIYQAQPVVRLQLCREYNKIKTKCFPTRISWSKVSGHRYVAVGYTDGMVAIFDIETQSDILKQKDHLGIETILPFKTLKAHIHYISVLSLIHLGGGRRYLLTGSFDRNIILWDLTDDSCSMIQRKKIISDGTWLTNWISHVSTADESCTSTGNINSTIISHRYYLSDMVHIMATPASLTSVSSSDWLNGILQSTSSGETLAIFPNQLLYGLDNDKRLKSLKWMLGYSRLIDLSKSPEERVKDDAMERASIKPEKKNDNSTSDSTFYILNYGDQLKQYQPHTYEKAVEKYGLVICDIKRKGFEEPSFNLSDVLEPSRPDLYPLQAINKVAFNPNCQSSLYFAAGYQVGFVRLRYMRFLENDKQVV